MTTSWAPWPLVWVGDAPTTDEDVMAAARSAAQTMLWSRTGRRLGTATAVEGFVMPSASGECGGPYLGDDLIWRHGLSSTGATLFLPGQPVQSVESVKLDGVPLSSSAYEVRGSTIVRTDGGWWPTALVNDQTRIVVAYTHGVALDENGPLTGLASLAMGEVTAELIAGMQGRPCKLPSRAVTITRQGVTVQLGDPQTYIDNMLLGMPIADQLILSTNPGRRRGRSRVHSPDMPRVHRVVAS